MKSRLASDSSGLIVASIVNGLAAYAFAMLGLRVYGPEDFAPVAIVWSIWALAVAATTFPIQHWVNWRAGVDGGLGNVRATTPRIGAYVIAAAAMVTALVTVTIPSMREVAGWSLLMAALVAGSGILGWGRGVLAAGGGYRDVAIVIGAENLVRLAAGVIVVLAGGGVLAFSWALAMGPLVLVPMSTRMDVGPIGVRVPLIRSLGSLSAAVLVAQAFLQLSPVGVEWMDAEDAEVSAVFSTFALFRSPVLMGLAVVTRLTTPFTTMVVSGDRSRFGQLLHWLGGALLVGTPVAFFGSGTLGPAVVRMIFGEGTDLGWGETALVGAGMWVALIGVVVLVLHVTTESTIEAMVIWGLAGAVAVTVAVFSTGAVTGVARGFAAGEMLAVAGSLIAHSLRLRRWGRSS